MRWCELKVFVGCVNMVGSLNKLLHRLKVCVLSIRSCVFVMYFLLLLW